MKIVAKNQNVRLTRCRADDSFQKIVQALDQPFQEILRPVGNQLHVACRDPGKNDQAQATIQVTTMEFVIGKPNGRAISSAFCDSPSFWSRGTVLAGFTCSASLAATSESGCSLRLLWENVGLKLNTDCKNYECERGACIFYKSRWFDTHFSVTSVRAPMLVSYSVVW